MALPLVLGAGIGLGVLGSMFRERASLGDFGQYGEDRERALQARLAQQGLLGQLGAQAAGGGPSVGAEATRVGLEESRALAASQAAGARGVSRAAALRTASLAGQQATSAAAGQGAMLRAQEALAARQMQVGLLGQQRQQDIAQQQAGLGRVQTQLQAEQFREANAGPLDIVRKLPVISDERRKRDIELVSDEDMRLFLDAVRRRYRAEMQD